MVEYHVIREVLTRTRSNVCSSRGSRRWASPATGRATRTCGSAPVSDWVSTIRLLSERATSLNSVTRRSDRARRSMHIVSLPTPDFASGLSGARVLVTGGSGFIGTNLVHVYKRAGVAVTSLDIAQPRNPEHRDVWLDGDVTSLDELRTAFATARPTHVFHLAALISTARPSMITPPTWPGSRTSSARCGRADTPVVRTVFASSRLVCRLGYQPRAQGPLSPDHRVRREQGAYRATGPRSDRPAVGARASNLDLGAMGRGALPRLLHEHRARTLRAPVRTAHRRASATWAIRPGSCIG